MSQALKTENENGDENSEREVFFENDIKWILFA